MVSSSNIQEKSRILWHSEWMPAWSRTHADQTSSEPWKQCNWSQGHYSVLDTFLSSILEKSKIFSNIQLIGYKYTKGLFNNFERFEVNDVPSIQYPAVVHGHFSILIWGHNQWTCRLRTRSIPKCPNSLPSNIKLAYNSRVYSIPPPNLIFCVKCFKQDPFLSQI